MIIDHGKRKDDDKNFTNDYDRACDKLQLNAIPERLPCREKERKIIEEYLYSGL